MLPRKRRPRHQDKDWEKFLRKLEAQGWRVTKGNRYFTIKCGCGQHMKQIVLTPSDPNKLKNDTHWVRRASCWDTESGGL